MNLWTVFPLFTRGHRSHELSKTDSVDENSPMSDFLNSSNQEAKESAHLRNVF